MRQNVKYLVSVIKLGFVVIILNRQAAFTAEERLIIVSTNECVCPGNIVTYECTVFGGIGATTVWKSDIFQCSSGKQVIEFVHKLSTLEEGYRVCNNGDIAGRIVRIENNHFTSQLNVTLSYDVAGRNIECISDNGTNTHRIGLLNITTLTAILLPPENISWMISYQQLHSDIYIIAFNWNTHPSDSCPTHNIAASNCGSCPATTNHTTVTCTDVPIIDGGVCMFAVQTVICEGITGELSPYVSVDIFNCKDSSRFSSALVSAIILGVALVISLVGYATVAIILLIKTKIKVQNGAMPVTFPSRKAVPIENRSIHNDITTNENIAYVAHSLKTVMD